MAESGRIVLMDKTSGFIGKLHRQRRLVRGALQCGAGRDGGLPSRYFLKHGYAERTEFAPFEAEKAEGEVFQPDVYTRAGEVARDIGASTIVDLGCGTADKIGPLMTEFRTVGLDVGSNLDVCRERFPDAEWLECDLDTGGPLPVDTTHAVILCSDVIEHLRHPELLLEKIRSALDTGGALAALVSTPERDLLHGPKHMGPPPNTSHVREWAWKEFSALLAAHGFHNGTLELTRSRSSRPHRNTMLAILRP
jgi:SAM-dependent methyltransferase